MYGYFQRPGQREVFTRPEYAEADSRLRQAALGGAGQTAYGLAGAGGQIGSAMANSLADASKTYGQNFNSFAGGLTGINQAATTGMADLGRSFSQNYGALGNTLGALGNSGALAFQGYGQGLAGLGQSQANAYGSYAGGLGNAATAMANERSNFYAANSQAEIARQTALGNLGVAALGAYGGIGNSALAAWAQNQQAYNRSLADITAANQAGLSQLGQSRNAALGQLGGSFADLGGRAAAANAIGNLNMNMSMGAGAPGGGFSAAGPGGEIASGSFGGVDGGGLSLAASRSAGNAGDAIAPAFAGLNQTSRNLMADDISGALARSSTNAMDRLDRQHLSSRNMPSDLMSQALAGLRTLGQDAYGQSRSGMDQFYGVQTDPRNRADYSGVLNQLASGYEDASGRISGLAGQMGQGFRDTSSQLDRLSGAAQSGFRDTNRNVRSLLSPMLDLARTSSDRLVTGFNDSNRGVRDAIGTISTAVPAFWNNMFNNVSGLWNSSMNRAMAPNVAPPPPTPREPLISMRAFAATNPHSARWSDTAPGRGGWKRG